MGLTVQIRGLRPGATMCLELLEKFSPDDIDCQISPDPSFRFEKSLELRNTGFRYPSAGESCLHGVSVRIARGECVGLVGRSGSGKSTVAMLLAGLLEPTAGELLVDGKTLTPGGRESFRHRVGFVPQNPLLLPGTIADNIALSRWGEEYDRAKVEVAGRLADMDFLRDNPHGLDYVIGDGGMGLSGGQAQRVSIARALFGDPEMLILDEATSSLDLASECAITRAIAGLRGRMTSVVIAHRLSTIEHCDRIIWLDAGRVVATGTPAEILPSYRESMGGERGHDGLTVVRNEELELATA